MSGCQGNHLSRYAFLSDFSTQETLPNHHNCSESGKTWGKNRVYNKLILDARQQSVGLRKGSFKQGLLIIRFHQLWLVPQHILL